MRRNQASSVSSIAPREPVAKLARLVELTVGGPLIELPDGTRLVAQSTVAPAELHGREGCSLLTLSLSDGGAVVTGVVHAFDAPPLDGVAEVDGKRVVIRGAEEIVLTCGESSLTMRANGQIILRGVHVESRGRRLNRIRGGAVRIN